MDELGRRKFIVILDLTCTGAKHKVQSPDKLELPVMGEAEVVMRHARGGGRPQRGTIKVDVKSAHRLEVILRKD